MGMKPRSPKNDHRKRYAMVEYLIKRDVFQAREWKHYSHEIPMELEDAEGPITAGMAMAREDFERLEGQGRAVDLCQPNRGGGPRMPLHGAPVR